MNEKFKISSQSLKDGEIFGKKNIQKGLGGEDLSPDLSWSGVSEGVKSYAITMFDPDAPTGFGWRHWLVYNIPSGITSLIEGQSTSLPKGALTVKNDGDVVGYSGPYPPPGTGKHRYIITVYALDIDKIDLDPNEASAGLVGFYIWQHTLAKASITPFYENK